MIFIPGNYENEFAQVVRVHWQIEVQLHWKLDVVMRKMYAKFPQMRARICGGMSSCCDEFTDGR